MQIHPSGEPVTARLPIYQGETVLVCLTVTALCRPEENTQKYAALYSQSIVDARCDKTLSLLPFNAAVSDDLLVPASMPPLPFSSVLPILARASGAILLGALRVVEPHTCRRR